MVSLFTDLLMCKVCLTASNTVFRCGRCGPAKSLNSTEYLASEIFASLSSPNIFCLTHRAIYSPFTLKQRNWDWQAFSTILIIILIPWGLITSNLIYAKIFWILISCEFKVVLLYFFIFFQQGIVFDLLLQRWSYWNRFALFTSVFLSVQHW